MPSAAAIKDDAASDTYTPVAFDDINAIGGCCSAVH